MTRLSAKNQITIPVAVIRKAGLQPGDDLIVEVDEKGRIVVQSEAAVDPVTACAGALTGVYGPNYLEELRAGDLEREIELGLIRPEDLEDEQVSP
jgi:AbrB family looped-hinge helix DNA binding protein